MSPPWWDVALNDHLCARWGHGCLLCGAGNIEWAWTRVVHGVTIGIGLCARCHQQDAQHGGGLLRQACAVAVRSARLHAKGNIACVIRSRGGYGDEETFSL